MFVKLFYLYPSCKEALSEALRGVMIKALVDQMKVEVAALCGPHYGFHQTLSLFSLLLRRLRLACLYSRRRLKYIF